MRRKLKICGGINTKISDTLHSIFTLDVNKASNLLNYTVVARFFIKLCFGQINQDITGDLQYNVGENDKDNHDNVSDFCREMLSRRLSPCD